MTTTPSAATDEVPPFGGLRHPAGLLPLRGMDVQIDVVGLDAVTHLTQRYVNAGAGPTEVSYIFPLPGRAAVTGLEAVLGGRRVLARLEERQVARDLYDAALADGRRAGILEEERPEVLTVRVGNLGPGEEAVVHLTMVHRLPVDDGQAAIRFPLVVAPRYVPGDPVDGRPVGDGVAFDTAVVPDASRVTPPQLLPGHPDLADLSIEVRLDPAGLRCSDLRSTLHAVTTSGAVGDGPVTLRLDQRSGIDRDFIVRFAVETPEAPAAVFVHDPTGVERLPGSATLLVTMVPPVASDPAPVDVVVVLDRSGSMRGWKMVAARRSAARLIDSLGAADRFALVAFDGVLEWPGEGDGALVAATDEARYRAIEWLAKLEARGGTELDAALRWALDAAAGEPRRTASVVVITDGQVADEDRLVRTVGSLAGSVHLHAVGIDRAVNAGILDRLTRLGMGHLDLVESEQRLDRSMTGIHRRIRTPVLRDVAIDGPGVVVGTVTPGGSADAFAGVPLVLAARCSGDDPIRIRATGADGAEVCWSISSRVAGPADLRAVWGRSRLRDLEDRLAVRASDAVAADIVRTSLDTGVLCRHTAFVAIDDSGDRVAGPAVRLTQPVPAPSGWAPGARPMLTGRPLPPHSGWVAAGAPRSAASPAGPPTPVRRPSAEGRVVWRRTRRVTSHDWRDLARHLAAAALALEPAAVLEPAVVSGLLDQLDEVIRARGAAAAGDRFDRALRSLRSALRSTDPTRVRSAVRRLVEMLERRPPPDGRPSGGQDGSDG